MRDDPMFVRRAFVSHYLSIPYHLLLDKELYPTTLVEELFAVASYLIRNFELAPYKSGNLEEKLVSDIESGKL